MHRTASTIKQREEFIRNNYPDIHKINPYTNHKLIAEIKYKLFEAGFYTRDGYKYSANVDASIIKMIDRIKAERLVLKK